MISETRLVEDHISKGNVKDLVAAFLTQIGVIKKGEDIVKFNLGEANQDGQMPFMLLLKSNAKEA